MTTRVILQRGVLPDRIWEHTTPSSAWRRAEALEKLHNTTAVMQYDIITVNASHYYRKKHSNLPPKTLAGC